VLVNEEVRVSSAGAGADAGAGAVRAEDVWPQRVGWFFGENQMCRG